MTPDEHEIEQSFRYRLGDLLVRTARSPLTVFLLPIRLFRLVQHARRRSASLQAVANLECGLGLEQLRQTASLQPCSLTAAKSLLHGRPAELTDVEPLWLGQANQLIEDFGLNPRVPARRAVEAAGRGRDEMRVTSVLHSSLPEHVNGYGIRSQAMLDNLVALGWDVRAVVRHQKMHDVKQDRVVYRALQCSYAGQGFWTYVERLSKTITAAAKDHEARTIHSASNFICGYAAMLAARRLGLPFVYEVRGLWHITRASHEAGFDSTPCYAFQDRMESVVACEADTLVTLNTPLADYLVERGAERNKIIVAPNGVDHTAFHFSDDELMSTREAHNLLGKRIIGFCGSLTPYEGLDFLIAAIRPLLLSQPELVLLIVGSGPFKLELEARVAELGLGGHVRFTGYVAPDEAKRLTALFEVAPFPRPWSPVNALVTPLKPMEALAAGADVLVSTVPPLAELASGDMVAPLDPTDAKAWAAAIEASLKSSRVKTRRLKAARGVGDWHDAAKALSEALRISTIDSANSHGTDRN